jgi:hypothetical protein
MMAKHRHETFIKGIATHRRTEGDYMGVLLDTVTLDDWQDVVSGALQAAKAGDPSARAWLAQYLVGKPEGKAPTPLTVVVQQWSGNDPVADKLARPIINREMYPSLRENDEWEESIRSLITAELAQKLPTLEAGSDDSTD